MSMTSPEHKYPTLALIGVLHAFTHVYQVALLPLYLPIQQSFGLKSVGSSTFLVTLLMVAYFLPSYPMGVLADRVSRKTLLGLGLAINGLGFIGLGLAPSYPVALAAMVVAGFGGSFFHPAATALVARLFPANTGRALGLIGMGAGAGFFLGPLYAGWRATQAGTWRAPVLELGVAGLVAAALFHWLAVEAPTTRPAQEKTGHKGGVFGSVPVGLLFVAAALSFSLRDFAGSSMGSLGSLFLQNAHGFSVQQTGVALSGIFLASIVSNPLFGHLSDRGPKRWTFLVQVVAAGLIAAFPHVSPDRAGSYFWAFMAYGFFFMASYPMVEGVVMQSVPDAVRGRAFGLWITIGGLIGNLSHWLVGRWVEGSGPRAASAATYTPLYLLLAALLLLSLNGLLFLEAMRRRREQGLLAASPAQPPAPPLSPAPPGQPRSALE
jgi:MFS family permease